MTYTQFFIKQISEKNNIMKKVHYKIDNVLSLQDSET